MARSRPRWSLANAVSITPSRRIALALESRSVSLAGEPATVLEFPQAKQVALLAQPGQITLSAMGVPGEAGATGPAGAGVYLATGVAGTTNATAVTSPAFVAYPADGLVIVKLPAGALTLNLNGVAQRNITFGNGGAVDATVFNGNAHVTLRIMAATFEIVSGV